MPRSVDIAEPDAKAIDRYRILMLQHATRAVRGSARACPFGEGDALRALYHVLEARAADDELVRLLPGLLPSLGQLRVEALRARPVSGSLPPAAGTIEELVQAILREQASGGPGFPRSGTGWFDATALALPASPAQVLAQARSVADMLPPSVRTFRGRLLVKDWWLGDFRQAPRAGAGGTPGFPADEQDAGTIRSARMARRPDVRNPLDGEDDPSPPGPMSVLAFSGEGPHGVVVRTVKAFDEQYSNAVALRIAGLEPEKYTRAGAALRHATSELMSQPAEHRLLILLSDGKPNDVDQYDGRYGVEDLRQAVVEARLQGISPFCLTIDRQAASYLPQVFGEHSYALLQRAELLPGVLLAWLRKLVAS